jgi:hypothetical protein
MFHFSFIQTFVPQIYAALPRDLQPIPTTTPEEVKTVKEVTSLVLAPRVNEILAYAMGIGGVVAFILIIVGAFQIILSAGNPDRVKAGKEMITSALAGLFLIIFSVLILRIIGWDILQIPGFGQ